MQIQLKLKTADDVCELMDEAGWDISNLKEDLARVDEGAGWIVQESKCRICNYEELSIMPIGGDNNNLSCGNCDSNAMQPKEELEWEKGKDNA